MLCLVLIINAATLRIHSQCFVVETEGPPTYERSVASWKNGMRNLISVQSPQLEGSSRWCLEPYVCLAITSWPTTYMPPCVAAPLYPPRSVSTQVNSNYRTINQKHPKH